MEEKTSPKKLIFKKYKILKVLGNGSFGNVFEGINIKTKQKVAIKTEDWKKKGNLLESEAYFLYHLKGFGIPEVKSFGVFGKFKVLVETLLGDSLSNIFSQLNYYFTLKDICMIAIQLIDRFEYIHSKYIIHRDIKPENIAIDYETNKIIYLIDFGLSKKYRSSRTGNHIKFSVPRRLTGTARYSSRNALGGKEQSRRDDLESLGYVLVFLGRGGYLPWQGIKCSSKLERYRKIYVMKKKIKAEVLCYGLPIEFQDYINYVKSLEFEQKPNYNYLRGLFINIMKKNNFSDDRLFSWLNDSNISKINERKSNKEKKIVDLFKRKESPKLRLYRNILNSCEKMNKNKNLNFTEIKVDQNIKNNLNIIKNEINYENRSFSKNRKHKKKESSKLSDKFGTQLTLIDVTLDIDDNTIEYEKNKKINLYNKNEDVIEDNNQKISINLNPLEISFKEVPLKRSLSQNDIVIANNEETFYDLDVDRLKGQSGKNKNVINNIIMKDKENSLVKNKNCKNIEISPIKNENKIKLNSKENNNLKKNNINNNKININSDKLYHDKNILNKKLIKLGEINKNINYKQNKNIGINHYKKNPDYLNDSMKKLNKNLFDNQLNIYKLKNVNINSPKVKNHKKSISPIIKNKINKPYIININNSNRYTNFSRHHSPIKFITPINTINQSYQIPIKKNQFIYNNNNPLINKRNLQNVICNISPYNISKNLKNFENINNYIINKRIKFNKNDSRYNSFNKNKEQNNNNNLKIKKIKIDGNIKSKLINENINGNLYRNLSNEFFVYNGYNNSTINNNNLDLYYVPNSTMNNYNNLYSKINF